MKIKIRKEESRDYKKVEDLTFEAFEQAKLSEITTEHILVDRIRKSKNFDKNLSIVAEFENEIVGHIMLSKVDILTKDGQRIETLCLAPMSVIPKLQKQGIGSKLIRYSLKKAKELGYKSIFVLGHAEYYPKFGFLKAKNFNIKCEFDIPEEYFFVLELQKSVLNNVEGIVVFPEVFK